MLDVYINGFGAFFPGPPVGNDEMESYLGRIGGKPSRYRALVLRNNKIRSRHYALDTAGVAQHSNAGMAAAAIGAAVDSSELVLGDITYLATATTLGDVLLPGLASHVHAELELGPIEIASFQSVCTSSLMALKSAYAQVRIGEHRAAAVSGSEFASRYFRPGFYEHARAGEGTTPEAPFDAEFLRFTLSDGAGAVVLEPAPNARHLSLKIHWIDIRSFADRFAPSMLAGGAQDGDRLRFWGDYGDPVAAARAGALMLTQDIALMRSMIPVWVAHFVELVERGRIVIDEIDHVCCHYSSQSLRDETVKLLAAAGALIPQDKWFSNLTTRGNVGAASIFVLLEELTRARKLERGQK
ncbi:MAG: 3-oxoacyl-[acyl-carrier-protein] synthase, partial [Candidatus Eremiobacteraeota bacterium]|nr:3-oxoacyl-[acyl-carrier-protein] synthase [Candidatus Eremiobacteraeota bacterium]